MQIFAQRKSAWAYLALAAIVALSRVPFLDEGYGVNFDAWRVARVARQIAVTGVYEVSRFPGYPFQEIVCSWFWRGEALALVATRMAAQRAQMRRICSSIRLRQGTAHLPPAKKLRKKSA